MLDAFTAARDKKKKTKNKKARMRLAQVRMPAHDEERGEEQRPKPKTSRGARVREGDRVLCVPSFVFWQT